MKDLGRYLRARLGTLALLALSWAIFAALAALGGMASENVAYAAGLCAVCALCAAAVDFVRFRQKCRLLDELSRQTRLAEQNLPDCGANAVECGYQTLVRALIRGNADTVSRMDRRLADLTAYYTLWAHQIKTPIAAMRLLLQQEGAENGELGQELFRIDQYVDMAMQLQPSAMRRRASSAE